MKEKINRYYAIVMFFTFLIICLCSPLMGDDWGNFINGSGGLLSSIGYAFSSYMSYEGRIVSRILINILTYNKFLWTIINPIIISLIYFLSLKIIPRKDKYITPTLIFLAFLFVDVEGFRQVYVWLAGNITYLMPMIMIFYLLYLNRNFDYVPTRNQKIILPILSFISSMFVENVSVVIVVCYFFYIIFYRIKYKKINKLLVVSCVFSIIGTLIMVLSPGNANRLNTYPEFDSLNILQKLIYNIPNFISFTFIRNSFLVLLITIGVLFVSKSMLKNKIFRYLTYLYITIVPCITLIYNYLKTFGISIKCLEIFLNGNNIYIMIFWVIYMLLSFYIILKYIIKTKNYLSLLLIIMGFISNGVMMIVPVWGGRTAYLTAICLSLAMVGIVNNMKFIKNDNKVILFSSSFVLAIMIIFLFAGYRKVYIENIKREDYINSQLAAGNDIIEINVLSERFLWNPNPWDPDGYLARTFKLYYNIPQNKKIEMKR